MIAEPNYLTAMAHWSNNSDLPRQRRIRQSSKSRDRPEKLLETSPKVTPTGEVQDG